MKYTITITNDVGTMDYLTGLTLEEATRVCEKREWTLKDEAGGVWQMDIVAEE